LANVATITDTPSAGLHTYTVTATREGCGSNTASTSVTVQAPTAITGQPVSATKCAGESVTFSVSATGDGLTYQWRKNGANIPGATGSSLAIAAVAVADASRSTTRVRFK